MFFQSLPSSIGLAFLNPKPFNMPCFSYIRRLLIKNCQQNAQTTKSDWIKFEIPIFCAKNRVTICTRLKIKNSDYLIVLKIDIWKTEYCQLYSFSFSQTFEGSRLKNAGKMHKLQNRTGLSLKYQYFVQRIELQSVQG